MPKPPPYVTIACPDLWQVKAAAAHARLLKAIGFKRALRFGGWFDASFAPPLDLEAMPILTRKLIEAGFVFSAGRDWSPAEVVEDLRDRGLLHGPFTEIAWTGPEWVLRTR